MRVEKHRKFDTGCALLFAIVFGVIFLFSLWTPLIADDYNYTFGYSTGTRISSLRDIWISMAWHRRLLNPRVIAHGLLSLVLMYPRWVFAAVNGAAAVFFTWTTEAFFREQGSRQPVRMTAMVWMLLWICMPGFGQIFFWTAGACNYFWSMAFSWFIICRVIHMEQQRVKCRRSLLLMVPAFVAGAWSEHISFAMLMVLFLLLIRNWVRTSLFPREEAVLLLSGAAGYLFLMLAPSAKLFQRLHDAGDPTEQGVLTQLLSALPNGAGPAFLAGLLLVMVIVLLIGKKRGKRTALIVLTSVCAIFSGTAFLLFAFRAFEYRRIWGMLSSAPAGFFLSLAIYCTVLTTSLAQRTKKEQIALAAIFVVSGFSGFALFLFGEYIPIRGFCAPVTMLILATVYLAEPNGNATGKALRAAKSWLLAACFAICFTFGSADIYRVHQAAVEREAAFTEAAAGDKRVILKRYPCRTKYSAQYGNQDLLPDADWPNGVMADYYNVIRIIVEE